MNNLLKTVTLLFLATAPAAAAEDLRYLGTPGRVTDYRLTLCATGQQVSLGERRPVRVTAEYALREEVTAVEPDGSLRLRVTGKPIEVKDGTGAVGGPRAGWPTWRLHISPRGEVLEMTTEGGEAQASLAARAAASLAQPRPIILPAGPVEAGATWQSEAEGATQTGRLVSVTAGPSPVARLAVTGRMPLKLHESSAPLGLDVDLTGSESEEGTVEFSVAEGRVLSHKGNAVLQTKTQVTLATPQGNRTFPMELALRVTFELRSVKSSSGPARPAGAGT